MAKLTAVVLILTALAAVASASTYTTVVTTRMSDERCEKEIEEQMPLEQCEMWVQSAAPYMEGAFLRSRKFKEEHKEKCCAELRQVSSGCRCDAVKEMMMGMPQMQMKWMACSLPSMCGMSPCACPRVFA